MQADRRHRLVLLLALVAGPAVAAGPMAHMDDDPVLASLRLDQLEWQGDGGDAGWDVEAWAGRDERRVVLRAKGERSDGTIAENRLELLGWWPIASRWNLVAGVRQDFEPGSPRSSLAVGVEGLAPGWVHVEATLAAGERRQLALDLDASTDLLLTNRLILEPRAELEAYGKDDAANGLGSGLSRVTLGLRLRYELRRKVAPYTGIEWAGRLGGTADLARDAGESVRDARWVAGVRAWF